MTTTKISEFLIEAKKLIQDESNWTQGFYAKTKNGNFVDSHSDQAACFCSVGAMIKVRGHRGRSPAHHESALIQYAAEAQLRLAMGTAVPEFNDTNNHQIVMEAWDKAIADSIEKGI